MNYRLGALLAVVVLLTTADVGHRVVPDLYADGVDVIRLLLAVCSVGLIAVAVGHVVAGRTTQGIGHALAGTGLGITAAFGDGVAVWVGILVAVVGAALLLRDARRRGPRRQPFT